MLCLHASKDKRGDWWKLNQESSLKPEYCQSRLIPIVERCKVFEQLRKVWQFEECVCPAFDECQLAPDLLLALCGHSPTTYTIPVTRL